MIRQFILVEGNGDCLTEEVHFCDACLNKGFEVATFYSQGLTSQRCPKCGELAANSSGHFPRLVTAYGIYPSISLRKDNHYEKT